MSTPQYIIYSDGRGDYVTAIRPDGEIRGGSASDAIRYSADEAAEVLASLGRGYSVEDAEDAEDAWDRQVSYTQCMERCAAACRAGKSEEEEYWHELAEAIEDKNAARERELVAEMAKYGYDSAGDFTVEVEELNESVVHHPYAR